MILLYIGQNAVILTSLTTLRVFSDLSLQKGLVLLHLSKEEYL